MSASKISALAIPTNLNNVSQDVDSNSPQRVDKSVITLDHGNNIDNRFKERLAASSGRTNF